MVYLGGRRSVNRPAKLYGISCPRTIFHGACCCGWVFHYYYIFSVTKFGRNDAELELKRLDKQRGPNG